MIKEFTCAACGKIEFSEWVPFGWRYYTPVGESEDGLPFRCQDCDEQGPEEDSSVGFLNLMLSMREDMFFKKVTQAHG